MRAAKLVHELLPERGAALFEQLGANAQPVLAVPLTAVVRSEAGTGQFAVLVVQREKNLDVARVRRVELGEVMGNLIAVRTGVTPGERVVVSGATLLVDGTPVQVVP